MRKFDFVCATAVQTQLLSFPQKIVQLKNNWFDNFPNLFFDHQMLTCNCDLGIVTWPELAHMAEYHNMKFIVLKWQFSQIFWLSAHHLLPGPEWGDVGDHHAECRAVEEECHADPGQCYTFYNCSVPTGLGIPIFTRYTEKLANQGGISNYLAWWENSSWWRLVQEHQYRLELSEHNNGLILSRNYQQSMVWGHNL